MLQELKAGLVEIRGGGADSVNSYIECAVEGLYYTQNVCPFVRIGSIRPLYRKRVFPPLLGVGGGSQFGRLER
jgi:hypothetical protein